MTKNKIKVKELDPINQKILEILQDNSSITNSELARKVGLAPASTLERVRKLENNGVIKKYVALVDAEKVGKDIVVIVIITMSEHSVDTLNKFNQAIQKMPEVLECHRLAGDKDILLKIVTDDIRSYEVFAIEKLGKIAGIARVNTYFVLSSPKQQTKIPILDE